MNIFVGGIPFSMEEREVKQQFEKFGTVASIRVITDKFTGRSKGFGFIEMPNDEEAKKAIAALDGLEIGGKTLGVRVAEERAPKERRDDRSDRGPKRW